MLGLERERLNRTEMVLEIVPRTGALISATVLCQKMDTEAHAMANNITGTKNGQDSNHFPPPTGVAAAIGRGGNLFFV